VSALRRLLAVAAVAVAGVLAAAAPGDAASGLTLFQSPSHRIACGYLHFEGERPSLRCDVPDVVHKPRRPASCDLEYGIAFGLELHGKARRLCVGDTVADPKAAVLAYGHTRRFGSFRCTSKRTGMVCRSSSGHGFELSRERQRLF
jgi:hypothetical protein